MSVILSLALEVRGTKKNIDEFWSRLNTKNDPFIEQHFPGLDLNGSPSPHHPSNGFNVIKSEGDEVIIISWDGGFGGFSEGYMGSTFRDSGVAISEMFPELEFTLYYDGSGAEFAGDYGVETYSIDGKKISKTVFSGGARFRAGVRIGEKALDAEDYFISNADAQDDNDFWESDVPDFVNNRNKIDAAIQNGDLRLSTAFYRNEWEKSAIKDDASYLFIREFWKEVPLINTQKIYVDAVVARSAFAQSEHSIMFIPEQFVTNEMRLALSNKNLLLRYFSLSPESQKSKLNEFGSALAVTLTISMLISNPVNRLVEENPKKYEGANKDIFTESWIKSRLAALYTHDKTCEIMSHSITESITAGDVAGFNSSLINSIRNFCSSKFDN